MRNDNILTLFRDVKPLRKRLICSTPLAKKRLTSFIAEVGLPRHKAKFYQCLNSGCIIVWIDNNNFLVLNRLVTPFYIKRRTK